MNKRFRLILAFLSVLVAVAELRAQDPEFTQFYANPLYLNPAFAGTNRCPRLVMNYRNQWPSLTGNFVTTSASYDQYVNTIQGGLGLIVMNDRAAQGTLNTTTLSGMYSYQQPFRGSFQLRQDFKQAIFKKHWIGAS